MHHEAKLVQPGCRAAFVVGSGRCGSTLLSTLLRDHSDVLSLSEFFTVLGGRSLFRSDFGGRTDEFWRLLSTPQDDMTELRSARPAIPEILARDVPCREGVAPLLLVPFPHLTADPDMLFREARKFVLSQAPATLAEHCARFFAWLAQQSRACVWVERSGASLGYVEHLVNGFHGARFLHLHRAGPACGASMSRHPYFQVMLARLLANDPGMPIRRCLDRASSIPLDRYGVHWSAVITHGLGVLAGLPSERVLHVRFEDLCAAPEPWLERVALFLEVSPDPAWVARCRTLIDSQRARREQRFDPRLVRACRIGERALQSL